MRLKAAKPRAAVVLAVAASGVALAAPTVYPTGTTVYEPEKTWNGYTVVSALGVPGVVVIDMNGRVVRRWDGFNLSSGGPARVLPGGIVVAPQGAVPGHLEAAALVAQDFSGKELWRFDRAEQMSVQDKQQWSARQHHDWQRTDFPAGYFSPGVAPRLAGGKTLLLTHGARTVPGIADLGLDDDRIIELDAQGNIAWEWRASDHVDELKFSAAARRAIRRVASRENFDWFHINAATYVGPNKWFDAGDKRFDPQNVIISSRQTSIVAIVARDGHIVWQLGPDYSASPEMQAIGQIIGQHHAHMIPPGLPGAGNILIFDNGGSGGYGDPSPISPNGDTIYQRPTSRVLEIDPVTLKVVWQYRGANFYSFNISGAQRLPNGNTLITEGAPGRIFEVTQGSEIVWEYMQAPSEGPRPTSTVYRAYRIPYDWLPQVKRPTEVAIAAPEPGSFHVPGTPGN